jgi:hypothetical protein
MKIHPEAARALNALADSITVSATKPPPNPDGPAWGQQHIGAHITDGDIIGRPQMFITDQFGNKGAFYTYIGDEPFGIEGNEFTKFLKLVDRVIAVPEFNRSLSNEYVETAIIDWCVDKTERQDGATETFSDFILRRAKKDVTYHQIWIPIAHLQVEEDFQFGDVKIITIPKSLFDAREQQALREHPDDAAKIGPYIEQQFRQVLQGNAAVALSIKGEERYAQDRARVIARDALGLLRFFHPAMFTSKMFCPSALLGSEFLPKKASLTIVGVNEFSYSRSIAHLHGEPWRLSQQELAYHRSSGSLDLAARLVSVDGLSEFGLRVRSSILTYSRGLTFPDISDRLVYSLSALEGLYLRDASEPIQQNLADRLAFTAYTDTNDRIKVAANCKKVYGARSQYIHHGRNAALPPEELDQFFLNAWAGLQSSLRHAFKFKTSDEFFTAIDRLKFS